MQTVCMALCQRLPQLGHQVATLRPNQQGFPSDYASGTEVFALDRSDRAHTETSISAALDIFRPDVTHVVSARLLLANRINALVRNVPWLLTIHSPVPWESAVPCFYGRNRLYYGARNARYAVNVLAHALVLRRWHFSRALCFSDHVARRLVALGCDSARLAVVPLGMPETSDVAPDNSDSVHVFPDGAYPRILTVAGISHHKGLHDAVRAIAGLLPSHPTLHYVVLGRVRDHGYASHLESLVRRLRLTRHVSFVSSAGDALKNAAFKQADLYLQPSHEEGFCLAFLEAAAASDRLVGTNTGEMPAMAPNDPLIRIVRRMNPDALQEGMLTVLRVAVSNELLAGRRARLKKEYSWSHFCTRVTSLYEEVLSDVRTPSAISGSKP